MNELSGSTRTTSKLNSLSHLRDSVTGTWVKPTVQTQRASETPEDVLATSQNSSQDSAEHSRITSVTQTVGKRSATVVGQSRVTLTQNIYTIGLPCSFSHALLLFCYNCFFSIAECWRPIKIFKGPEKMTWPRASR